MKTSPGERAAAPLEHIIADENPTRCVHCGFRTEPVRVDLDGTQHERCTHCQQSYIVCFEPDDTEEDEPAEMPEISQAEAEHLFGRRSPYPDFGSY